MITRYDRLLKLQSVFSELRQVVERDLAKARAERDALLQQRADIAAALERQEQFRDLTVASAIRNLARLANQIVDAERLIEAHRKRAADCFLKAKRAGELAARLRQQRSLLDARRDLAELTGRASLRQAH